MKKNKGWTIICALLKKRLKKVIWQGIKHTPPPYSMVSIKRPVLSNVLVWIFPQKSLLNDLVNLNFWEPQYMKIKDI